MSKSHVFNKLSSRIPSARVPVSRPIAGQFRDAIAVPSSLSTREMLQSILSVSQEKEPFFVVNLSKVVSQFQRWNACLPGVKPHYAIKSNPDRRILQTLNSLGSNFDCASQKEIQEVLSITKDPSRIIFANPYKIPYQLEYAASVGVERVTADNVSELEKLAFFHPRAKILIRLKPDDSKSLCQFSSKFGATLQEAQEMLQYAKVHDLSVVGVSFHVGSGCQSAQTYADILRDSAHVFRSAADLGLHLNVVDIGGGFPGLSQTSGDSFEVMGQTILSSIQEHFAGCDDLEVIGEPGRFFSAGSSSLLMTVIGKKACEVNGAPGFKYYVDEGVYGAFNCLIFDHVTPKLELLTPRSTPDQPSVVFGPTCDSIDKLGEFQLPELFVGDKIFVENFGAYTTASSSAFNGFQNTRRFYVHNV